MSTITETFVAYLVRKGNVETITLEWSEYSHG